jgi:hypothetical protein
VRVGGGDDEFHVSGGVGMGCLVGRLGLDTGSIGVLLHYIVDMDCVVVCIYQAMV